ncbi:hypothetical protein BJV78DRAFT_1191180 [Lactifluus subvellereus]|nr:hypothetical protein BJV78DRAFT_1191180 [Lactifluus subvellereus]
MSTVPLETSASSVVDPDEPSPNLVFDYPGADIILRSRDSRDFRVPKLYIVNSSPVLGELIQNASNSSDAAHTEESLPTVQLSDSGAILHHLLTFIFPVSPIPPSTIEKRMELLSVAQEYQMNSTMTHIQGSIALQDSSSIDAFRVYSLAQKYGLRQEALQAARTILTFSMTIEDLEDKLDIMPGASLHELWKYHERVRTLLASDLAEFRDSGARGTMMDLRCTAFSPSLIPRWLDSYIESIGETPNLFDLVEFDITLARHIRDEATDPRCACASMTSQTIRTFWTTLTATVHGSIEKAGSALSLVQEGVNSQVKSLSRPEPLEVPDADLILRSADLVHFRVHKSLLIMASPFFKDLLSLPQPPDSEVADGLPIVQLSEDAELLRDLIPMLYPIHPVIPSPWRGEKMLSVLAACEKYDMVSIQSLIRAEVRCRPSYNSLGSGAFYIYALASSKGLTPEMEHAARLTLDYPMTFETLGERLRLFEGWALRDLFVPGPQRFGLVVPMP